MSTNISSYRFNSAEGSHTRAYLWPVVFKEFDRAVAGGAAKRAFDLGCGNGALAAELAQRGFAVAGVDPSADGIAIARRAHPQHRLEPGSTADDLAGRFGTFPLVVSLEVVEHVYEPRLFARRAFELLEPGGTAVISTPYHGYLKNLLLAATGKLDAHFTALWDGGHIKFWSVKTLGQLLREAGFRKIFFHRVGRVAPLAKSMIAVARK